MSLSPTKPEIPLPSPLPEINLLDPFDRYNRLSSWLISQIPQSELHQNPEKTELSSHTFLFETPYRQDEPDRWTTTNLPRYLIWDNPEEKLGNGGMSEIVCDGYDFDMQTGVAIKVTNTSRLEVLNTDKYNDTAHAVALQLAHINRTLARQNIHIPTLYNLVHDPAVDPNKYYTVMERVKGTHPIEYLEQHESTYLTTLKHIVKQIQEATTTLYDTGHILMDDGKENLMHLDLKPANILIANDGTLNLIDFDLLRMYYRHNTLTTKDDTIVGTPRYMSPERIEDETGLILTEASEVFSLGIILYEFLTNNSHPFIPDLLILSPMETGNAIVGNDYLPIPPDSAGYSKNQSLNQQINDFFLHALAKDKSLRIQTIDELCDQFCNLLDILLVEKPEPIPTPSRTAP